ncbi:PAS domain-containing protein [Falsirhodobacter sp. 20TX0035]|uniref:PAS domain-containing protein n=1 Tax=Falsirhodobacter sp. 20TX0035 TaxID=3022019 RepID=UPI002330016B|nr:PAS domain-containing protein [Falsirhodobacter sp. 20TX0035]MDB6455018.1 PAS domain-containing protein [Falsirhodobacter sp. 20TX0035]
MDLPSNTTGAEPMLPNLDDPFAAAVVATRMPIIVTDPRLPDNPIVFVNDAVTKLTGYSREDLLGRNCRFLQGPGTNVNDITRLRDAIARRESIEIDLLNYRKDGSSFWNRLLVSPVFSKTGELTHFFASQFEVSPERNRVAELTRTQGELEVEIERRMHDVAASEARLHFILSGAKMGTWTLEIATKRLVSSVRCRAIFGRNPEDRFEPEDVLSSIHPEDRDCWEATLGKAIEDRSSFEIEYRIHTPTGERRWIDCRGEVSSDKGDVALTMVGVCQDITERKEAEEHRKLLARELAHRVKNTLATVKAVVVHSLKNSVDMKDALERVSGRIQAMSAAQDTLTNDSLTSADLRGVIEQVLEPFKTYDIRYDGPRLVLDERGVSALTLALFELATNSLKYGALSVEGGSVSISWEIVGEDRDRFIFHWSEMGGPKVKPRTRQGFGSTIIERVAAADMNGTARLLFEPAGVEFKLEAPIPMMNGDEASTAPGASEFRASRHRAEAPAAGRRRHPR